MVNQILNKIKKINPAKGVKEIKKDFQDRTTNLILGGFAFVAALAWNEAIKNFFEIYLPKNNGLIGKFIYAIMITLIVVIVSRYLGKISEQK